MGIKFSMKNGELMVQSDNTAFVSAAPPKKTNRQLSKEEEAKNLTRLFISYHAYEIDSTHKLGEDWTKTHYAYEGYWVPKCCYMHEGFFDYWWRYESFEVFKQEADFHRPFKKRRMTSEEREIRRSIQAHREAYSDEADKKQKWISGTSLPISGGPPEESEFMKAYMEGR